MPRRLALLCLTLILAGCAAGFGKITPWRSGAVPSSATLEDSIIPRGANEQDPAVRRSIAEAQEELLVPSVSIAVMRRGRIDWTKAYGEGIDPNTRYQAASLSKAVAAAGILRLAEIENVDLDTDISSDFTDVDLAQLNPKGLPITLRGLLSHTNGMTGRGYPGYAAGRALPTTAQVINGSEVTNTKPVQLKAEWVGTFHYSGGGYTLAQRWAETISGKNFADLMDQLILKPVGMKRSTFALHTPETFPTDNVARAFVRTGKPIDGGWHVYPEMAAAGLWTTPTDYLLFVRAVMAGAEGKDFGITPGVATSMVTIIDDNYGLGVVVLDGFEQIRHLGSNRGYKSGFVGVPSTMSGIVTMTNAESGARLRSQINRSAEIVFGWSEPQPQEAP